MFSGSQQAWREAWFFWLCLAIVLSNAIYICIVDYGYVVPSSLSHLHIPCQINIFGHGNKKFDSLGSSKVHLDGALHRGV